jgi:ATP-binding cassette subfamily B (MDR/TAP) protein 1
MAFTNSDADMAQANAAANRILSFREISQPSSQKSSTIPSTSEGGPKIELSHVKFKYPTRDVPVFKDLNLSIEAGQFAALVGPSGCGKTTVVTLLERFYNPQSGSITLDGVDISTLDMATYRKSLSLVSQEPTLYKGSVRDNVVLGVNPSDVTDDDIQQACKDAEIHDFITSLPDGYDTDVGLKGVALSGGQKQRICIARALIRKPRVLLLDEATSSLDSESEKLVQAAFERAAKGRTMLVVAHRLATVQNADVIFVFGDGKVLEKGSHGELLRRRGLYWQMVSPVSFLGRFEDAWSVLNVTDIQCSVSRRLLIGSRGDSRATYHCLEFSRVVWFLVGFRRAVRLLGHNFRSIKSIAILESSGFERTRHSTFEKICPFRKYLTSFTS